MSKAKIGWTDINLFTKPTNRWTTIAVCSFSQDQNQSLHKTLSQPPWITQYEHRVRYSAVVNYFYANELFLAVELK